MRRRRVERSAALAGLGEMQLEEVRGLVNLRGPGRTLTDSAVWLILPVSEAMAAGGVSEQVTSATMELPPP
jgi:hypothetical protein